MDTTTTLDGTIDRVLLGTFSGSRSVGLVSSPLEGILGMLAPSSPVVNKKHEETAGPVITISNCSEILDDVERRLAVDMDAGFCANVTREVLATLVEEVGGGGDGCVEWEGLSPFCAKEAARACYLLTKSLSSSPPTLVLVPPVLRLLWSMIDGREEPSTPSNGFAKRQCLSTGDALTSCHLTSEFPNTRPDAHGRASSWCSAYEHQLLKARYEEAVGAYYQQTAHPTDALSRYSDVYTAYCSTLGPQHPRSMDAFLTLLELTEGEGVRDIGDGLRYLENSIHQPKDDDHLLVWSRLRRLQSTYAVHRSRYTEGQVCLRDVITVLENRSPLSLPLARVLALAQLECSELETCDDGEGPAGIEAGFRRFQQAKGVLRRLYRSDHPLVLHATCRLAALFVRRAMLEGLSQRYLLDPDEGGLSQEECFERAISLLSACIVEAKTNTSRVEVLTNYGDLLFEAGATSLAGEYFSTAVRLAGVVLGPAHMVYQALLFKWCSALLCELDGTHQQVPHARWHDWATKDLEGFSVNLPPCELDSARGIVDFLMDSYSKGLPTPPPAQLHHLRGTLLRVEGDIAGARQELELALHAHPNPQQHCRILDALGTVEEVAGNVDEAIRLTLRGLTIRRGRYGDRHVDVAAAHGNLAALYNKCGRWAESIGSADRCCAVLREVVATRLLRLNDESHPHSATAHVRGTVMSVSSDHPLYKKASAIRAASVKSRIGAVVK